MLQCKKGFTIIELLIVIFIIAIVTGVVAPTAYKIAERYKVYINKYEKIKNKEKLKYIDFLLDSSCILDKKKHLICKGAKVNNQLYSYVFKF